MAERDRAAVHVEPIARDTELPLEEDVAERECLVVLEEVDVRDP